MNKSILLAGVLFAASGCAKLDQAAQLLQGDPAGGTSTSKFSLCVHEAGAGDQAVMPALYCDTSSSSSMLLGEGKKYVFVINETSSNSYTYRMTYQRIDVVSAAESDPVVLQPGTNVITAPAMGDYAIKISAVQGTQVLPAKSYQSSVTCATPTPLNAAGLNASAITVSATGKNMYTFSSAGVIGGDAGGVAPYTCAWDFNGDGTRDSSFAPCDQAVTNRYVNMVGMRSIGLIVRDACYTTVSVRSSENVDPSLLTGLTPGSMDVFIHGQVSSPSGTAVNHAGIDGVNYYATNNTTYKPVQPNFSYNGANSSFTIASSYTYGMPSSTAFGMKLVVSGLNASLTDTLATSTISAASAVLSRLEYTTDQAGDAQAQIKLVGTSCTLTNPGARIVEVQGVPCNPGTTNAEWGDRMMTWSVHVYGTYSCPVTGSGASAVVSGEFDGLAFLIDGCVGGGGGGGGGIVPIEL